MKTAACKSIRVTDEISAEGIKGPAAAFAEIFTVLFSFYFLIKYLEITRFGAVQTSLVGWDYFAHLMMAAFPAAAVYVSGRPMSDLGFSLSQFYDARVRRVSRVMFAELAVLWSMLFLMPHLAAGRTPALLLPPTYFADTYGLTGMWPDIAGWVLTLLFTMVFCGIGEEIFFRGYIQGRINRALGRPFRIRGIRFGWGLIFTSLVFGALHGISGYSPFVNPFAVPFNLPEAMITCVEGFIFGMLYEYTGGITAPAILHGAIGLFFGAIAF